MTSFFLDPKETGISKNQKRRTKPPSWKVIGGGLSVCEFLRIMSGLGVGAGERSQSDLDQTQAQDAGDQSETERGGREYFSSGVCCFGRFADLLGHSGIHKNGSFSFSNSRDEGLRVMLYKGFCSIQNDVHIRNLLNNCSGNKRSKS